MTGDEQQPGQPIPRDLPCTHPATLTVTGRPGVRWCPTCGVYLHPDGTQEVRS